MNSYIFMQILSVLGTGSVVILSWDRMMGYMQYSFWHIIIRAGFYRDFKPLDWLIENMEYIGYLMIFIGHMFALLGLLQQFATGDIYTKPYSFFVSSPMNNLGFLLIVYIYSERQAYRLKK